LGFIDHLLEEADKIPLSSTQVEAHPTIMPKAFTGLHSMSYTVRPPSPRKLAGGTAAAAVSADRLMVSFHFTVRTGVAVQVVNSGDDAVTVNIVMNGNINQRAPLPPKINLTVSKSTLAQMNSDAGDLYSLEQFQRGVYGFIFGGPLGDGLAEVFLSKGVLTDRYRTPLPGSAHDSEIIHVPVDSLSGNTPFSVDDSQPFPIYGHLTLKWERGGAADIIR
jgi:hypothetical protein